MINANQSIGTTYNYFDQKCITGEINFHIDDSVSQYISAGSKGICPNLVI